MLWDKTYRKLKITVQRLLSYGTTPHKIALTITLGIMFGTIPVLGVTTVLLIIVAFSLKLNMVLIQVANYLVYPIQVILYLPYLKLAKFFGANKTADISLESIRDVQESGVLHLLSQFGTLHLIAIILWFISWIPLSLISYNLILKAIAKKKFIPSTHRNNKK